MTGPLSRVINGFGYRPNRDAQPSSGTASVKFLKALSPPKPNPSSSKVEGGSLDESIILEDLYAKSYHISAPKICQVAVSESFHTLWKQVECYQSNIFQLGLLEKLSNHELGRSKKWVTFLNSLLQVYEPIFEFVKTNPSEFPISRTFIDRLRMIDKLTGDIKSYGKDRLFTTTPAANYCVDHLAKITRKDPPFLELHLFVFHYFPLFHGEIFKNWIESAQDKWDFISNVSTSFFDFEQIESLRTEYVKKFNDWFVQMEREYYEFVDIELELKNAFALYGRILEICDEELTDKQKGARRGSTIVLEMLLSGLDEEADC